MVRKKKGWWDQIQSGDYPETQKKYGNKDWISFNIKNKDPVKPINKEINSKERKFQHPKGCPICGNYYWPAKGECSNCGWGKINTNESKKEVKYEAQKRGIVKKPQ
jgi:ribosomal protein L37E